ncbi:MAG TPA: 50S ribosomal protein L29 [Candidatus Paceibacterota bacterium]
MTNMKEYKDKTAGDLTKLMAEKREQIRGFRFGSTGSKIKNVKLGRTLRKDIARIMTELSIRVRKESGKIKESVNIQTKEVKSKVRR